MVRDTIEAREQRFPMDAQLMKLISDCFLKGSGNDRMLNKSCRGVGLGRPKDRRLQVLSGLELGRSDHCCGCPRKMAFSVPLGSLAIHDKASSTDSRGFVFILAFTGIRVRATKRFMAIFREL